MPTEINAPGIYKQANGAYRVVAFVGDIRREKRFRKGTRLRAMQRWQGDTQSDLRRQDLRPALGTLTADVERYLARPEVTRLASAKSRASDTNAWTPAFGHMRRDQITADLVQQQIDSWRTAGIAVWTIRHRLNALRQVYTVLDGAGGYNPARKATAPPKPRSIPRALDYGTIYSTLNQMEPSATKAFLLVMASCGFRPAEIRRTAPWMIHLDDGQPHVIRNTAKGGDVVVVPLPEVGVLAWKMWLEHNPWDAEQGAWRMPSISNANRDWKEAMRRAGFEPTRCYDLVHSYCTQLLTAGGGDISLVQKARGHRDIRTTMIYTQVVVDPRLAGAVRQAFRTGAIRSAAS